MSNRIVQRVVAAVYRVGHETVFSRSGRCELPSRGSRDGRSPFGVVRVSQGLQPGPTRLSEESLCGRPLRFSSFSVSTSGFAAMRLRHLQTVRSVTPMRLAMSLFVNPSAAKIAMRARTTTRNGAQVLCASAESFWRFSLLSMMRRGGLPAGILVRYPELRDYSRTIQLSADDLF